MTLDEFLDKWGMGDNVDFLEDLLTYMRAAVDPVYEAGFNEGYHAAVRDILTVSDNSQPKNGRSEG